MKVNGKDFSLVFEWRTRMLLNYAACRNVFEQVFRNNWINGTLFAFPIKNDRKYTPVFTNFKKVIFLLILITQCTKLSHKVMPYGSWFINFDF
jgi:hypothetical protein